jgi:hypothetical protein
LNRCKFNDTKGIRKLLLPISSSVCMSDITFNLLFYILDSFDEYTPQNSYPCI